MSDQHLHTFYAVLSTSGAILADIAAPLAQDPTARFGIWAAGISLVGVALANTIKAIGGAVLDGVNKWSESNAGRVHQQIEDLQRAVGEAEGRITEANAKLQATRDEAAAEALRRNQEIDRLTSLLTWTQDRWHEAIRDVGRTSGPLISMPLDPTPTLPTPIVQDDSHAANQT